MNHKWENNICTKCGVKREKKTTKLLMAIVGSTNHYKYEQGYVYDGKTRVRPDCSLIRHLTLNL